MWRVCYFLLIINFIIISILAAYYYPDEDSIIVLLVWHFLVILERLLQRHLQRIHMLPFAVIKYNNETQYKEEIQAISSF